MSLSKLEVVKCPCGETFEAELWNSINVNQDPELKEALLAGEINVVCCPGCHEIFYAEHFILYQDSLSELLAFVYPLSFSEQRAYWTSRMNEDFQKAVGAFDEDKRIDYKPVILFGLDELVEIINTEEELNDEISILKYIAQDLGISTMMLHPSLARPRNVPKVIPRVKIKDGCMREEIIGGINKLLSHNRNLIHYKKLLESIEKDRKWSLDKSLIKEPAKKKSKKTVKA